MGNPAVGPGRSPSVGSGRAREQNRHVLVAAGLTFLASLAINQVVLLFVHRLRPYELGLTHLLVSPSSDASFPSDHATAAFAIAGAFLAHGALRRGGAFAVAAVLVSLTRVYVGTHYLSDVLGGAMVGLCVAYIIRAAYKSGTKLDRLVTSIF